MVNGIYHLPFNIHHSLSRLLNDVKGGNSIFLSRAKMLFLAAEIKSFV